MGDERPPGASGTLAALNRRVVADRRRHPVLLLGPGGGHLGLRTDAASELRSLGYRAIVMETYGGIVGETLFEKWERMLAETEPTMFAFVIPREAVLQGPHVEFGYLLHRDRPDGMRRRATFFLEESLDVDDALAYCVIEYLGKAGSRFFQDRGQLVRRIACAIAATILRGLR